MGTESIQKQFKHIGQDFRNNSILNNSYHWLLTNWQKVTLQWSQSSGKNWLLRTAWVLMSIMYAVLVTSLFLAILPIIFICAVLLALMLKSNMKKRNGPVTINVTPETN